MGLTELSRREFVAGFAVSATPLISGCELLSNRVEWEREFDSPVASGIIDENLVVLTASELHFLDRNDGSKINSFTLDAQPPVDIWGDTVFISDQDGVSAYTSEEQKWRIDLAGLEYPRISAGRELVLAADSMNLVVFHRRDGSIEWRQELPSEITGSPTYGAGRIFVPSTQGLSALYYDGSAAWSVELEESTCVTVDPSTVYTLDADTVYAFSARTGDRYWEQDGWVNGPAVIHQNIVYTGGSNLGVNAIDSRSGEPLWVHPLDMDDTDRFTTPTVADGIASFVRYKGKETEIYAVDSLSGEELWKENITSPQPFSPVSDGKRTFVGTKNDLLAFSLT